MKRYRESPRRADEHLKWLRSLYAEDTYRPEGRLQDAPPLAALTGTDFKALEAIDRAWTLFAYVRSTGTLRAIALLALEMQPHMRFLARELAARNMDWADRERYWPVVEAEGHKVSEGAKRPVGLWP